MPTAWEYRPLWQLETKEVKHLVRPEMIILHLRSAPPTSMIVPLDLAADVPKFSIPRGISNPGTCHLSIRNLKSLRQVSTFTRQYLRASGRHGMELLWRLLMWPGRWRCCSDHRQSSLASRQHNAQTFFRPC